MRKLSRSRTVQISNKRKRSPVEMGIVEDGGCGFVYAGWHSISNSPRSVFLLVAMIEIVTVIPGREGKSGENALVLLGRTW